MSNFYPKVSIVIPVYNGSNYLAEAIDSALAQTYKNIEVIVINDGSNDNGATEKIAKSYGNKIRYYKKENGGVATALNMGIEKMTGEYFSWLSHDDMYEKNKISEQIKFLSTLKDKQTVISCNAKVLFPSGIKKNEYIDNDTFRYIDIFLATSALVGVNGCSLLIPKKAFEISGVFDNNLPVTQDYDLWFRIAKNLPFKLLEKNLIISRRHEGQDSVKKQKICFEAGEDLHYRFLSEITQERFDDFFDYRHDAATNYLANYKIYKQNGYVLTSSLMMVRLLDYCRRKDKGMFDKLFNEEVGKIFNKGSVMDVEKVKPRIAVYCNVWERGGIERVLSLLIPHLEINYDCVLITGAEPGVGGMFNLPDSLTVIYINGASNINSGIVCVTSLLDIDLFIGNPNINENFLDIYPTLKRVGTKTVAYNHGYYFLPYLCGGYLYPTSLKIKSAYNSADAVVWLTKIANSIYNIDSKNGTYIPNPLSLDASLSPKAKVSKKIVAVGRFNDEIKQIHKTLLVFKEIIKLDDKFMLDIVGPVDLNMLIEEYGITLNDFITGLSIPASNLNFVGEVDDVDEYYDKSSMLLMTSKCEGFGMVFLEAMSKGLPCASFYYLGVEEIIHDGKNGIVEVQDNYKEMAIRIVELMGNNTAYLEMSKSAVSSVEKFNFKKFTNSWDSLLEKLLLNKPFAQNVQSLGAKEYAKIISEYDRTIKEVVRTYLADTAKNNLSKIKEPSRFEAIKHRLKISINNEGYFTTTEKIIRKVVKKLLSKIKS